MEDRCVVCGEIVPEGRMVCMKCEKQEYQLQNETIQKRTVKIEILLPMEFPVDWGDDDINFYLNESSWCWSNILPILNKYDDEHGCMCNICKGEVVVKKGEV